jgi:hypothetical protein
MTHMLSTILAKVTNIEKLLAPAIHNLPDSEILDSKGVRLLTKMSDRTLLRRRNDGSLPFHCDIGIFMPSSSSTMNLFCKNSV